ncbi:unnamed protein product [Adineta ricciae]|uniref:Uncharacterized protein n=1 Tax=Adineta ricciae TaxID=249248 RepID=A0A816CM80_ADIRI|nr:unnamed protein product [Adineta ricciae]CAF1625292.1 unnamed protein product [Adineta ricciae]
METIRLTLIFLHTVIIIFATVELYSHLNHIPDDKNKHISGIVHFVTDFLYIILYHVSSMIVIWYTNRSGSGMVRATGILLIGELIQVISMIIQLVLDPNFTMSNELLSFITYDMVLVAAVILTFRMSDQISKRRIDFMQIELLPDMISSRSVDSSNEPAFL